MFGQILLKIITIGPLNLNRAYIDKNSKETVAERERGTEFKPDQMREVIRLLNRTEGGSFPKV